MSTQAPEFSGSRALIIALICVAAFIGTLFLSPIPQDPTYHAFGDHRHLLGIDNFWNVVSNLPFILVGLFGLHECWRQRQVDSLKHLQLAAHRMPGILMMFFLGVLLTGIGSGYYHLNPNNTTLILDRLPMTVSFMAFFSLVIGSHIRFGLARWAILPLLGVGVWSVVYWSYTQAQGSGDLRWYALVQFLPIVLVPIIVAGSKSTFLNAKTICWIIGFYVLAKLLEHEDAVIFGLTGSEMSGHAIKHIAASVATFIVYQDVVKLRKRPSWAMTTGEVA
jgi:hypothetical protein